MAGFIHGTMLDLILGTLAVTAASVLRGTVSWIVTALVVTAMSIYVLNPMSATVLALIFTWTHFGRRRKFV